MECVAGAFLGKEYGTLGKEFGRLGGRPQQAEGAKKGIRDESFGAQAKLRMCKLID